MTAFSVWRVRISVGIAGTLALAAAIVPATASKASTATVAEPGGPTAVREHRGTIVFSEFDPTNRRWYLSVRKAGAKTAERVKVAPSPTPFNADIGTDSRGLPVALDAPLAGGTVLRLVSGRGLRDDRAAP